MAAGTSAPHTSGGTTEPTENSWVRTEYPMTATTTPMAAAGASNRPRPVPRPVPTARRSTAWWTGTVTAAAVTAQTLHTEETGANPAP